MLQPTDVIKMPIVTEKVTAATEHNQYAFRVDHRATKTDIKKGDEVGKLVVTLPDRDPIEAPLVAGDSVERLGFGGRLSAAAHHLLFGSAQ